MLPDFLIIGAMKAGTTGLYRDLEATCGVEFSCDKEPEVLCCEESVESLRRRYNALFERTKPGALRGDASTAYAKLPTYAGVVTRARALLPESTKIIYLIREPVGRILSQHHHEVVSGACQEKDLLRAIADRPTLLAYSRYATQLRPWVDAFGLDATLVVRFDDYVANRKETLSKVASFVGATFRVGHYDFGKVHNRSLGKPASRGLVAQVAQSRWYREGVRRGLPRSLRTVLAARLLPRSEFVPQEPGVDTVNYVWDCLEEEMDELTRLCCWDAPPWRREDVVREYQRDTG